MAVVFATERLNLLEAFNREEYQGYESLIGDLVQNNDFFRVATVLPSNHGATHNTLVADSLGKGAVRKINGSTVLMSSKTHVKSDPVVIYEGDSEVDEALLENAPDPVAVRVSEDGMNLTGFVNEWNRILLEGDKKTAEGFEGLATRRGKLGTYCLSAGGSSNLSSAYLVEFGETGTSLRYAPGATPGVYTRDNGRVKCTSADGNGYFWGWSQTYKFNFGITVRREASLWRICNINSMGNDITTMLEQVIRAKNKMPNRGRNAYMFVNPDVQSLIEIGLINKASQIKTVDIENYGPCLQFSNLSILPMDAISSAESVVA